MKEENLMKGSIITIYRDPITKQRPEGKAVLVGRIGIAGVVSDRELLILCAVRFLTNRPDSIRWSEREIVHRDVLVTKKEN